MNKCRVCDALIESFMSFGSMPIANSFLTPDEFEKEYFFDLDPAVCPECHTFQIMEVPDPSKMFHNHYAYFASTSEVMTKHFKRLSERIISNLLYSDNPFVVEIGSNDGIMLQNFANAKIRHLGIEPSTNVAEASRDKGINILCDYFREDIAEQIIESHGLADIFIATNTMHHISDINTVIAGIKKLLKPKGIVITEDPYLGDMIKLVSYEQIYAEHNFIWSITSLNNAFGRYGMEVIDVEPNEHHGGCMRYFLGHVGAHRHSQSLVKYLKKEKELGLDRIETFERFRKKCEISRNQIMNHLDDLNAKNKRVVGYGATAKSSTLINYCGINKEHIEFICDSTPIKQGKFSPGAHIPIKSEEYFQKHYPDYAFLFAWNHSNEIISKEKEYRLQGGKWIQYLPSFLIT